MKEEDVRFNLPPELDAIGARADDRSPPYEPEVFKSPTHLTAAACASRAAAPPRHLARTPASEQGYWWADLTADTTLESDYILLQLWLHPPRETASGIRPRGPLIDKAVRSILARQLPDGGFNIYAEGAVGDQRDGQGLFRAEAGRARL